MKSYNKEKWLEEKNKKKESLNSIIKDMAASYIKNPELIAEMLEFGTKFYEYSQKNNMLIYSQNRWATYVQSFDAWKKAGYNVIKGQKGLAVFVPVKTTLLKSGNEWIALSKADKKLQEEFKNGNVESRSLLDFNIGYVYDISQTDCPKEDYPKLFDMGYKSETHSLICEGIADFSKKHLGVDVIYKDLKSISLRGLHNRNLKKTIVSDKLEDTQKLCTLTHELGHALIHGQENEKSKVLKEFEADALSIMLQSNFGVEITDTRKRHLSEHFKKLQKEIEKENKDFNTNKEVEVDKILGDVYKIYKDNIENIEKCVEKHLEKNPLVSLEKGKKPSDTFCKNKKKDQEKDIEIEN